MTHQKINIAIVGGGVGGLALALHLHERGVVCHVFEAVAEVRELGVGITLLPHAMRELAALGIQPELEAAGIEKLWSNIYDDEGNIKETTFEGYSLEQNLKISSKKVDLVENTSRQVSELIDAGIELKSAAPQYYYTKLATLKLKMIEAATKDAHERAEKIAENGGGSLGKLMFADMGIFQITAENSSEEYEWGGSFNTSSRRKTASVTIRLKYAID